MSKSTVRLGLDNILEDRDIPSVTVIDTPRIPDPNTPNIIAITHQTTTDIASAFGPTGMVDGWKLLDRANGQTTDAAFGQPFGGYPGLVGAGRDGAPETMNVKPQIALDIVSDTTIRIRYTNLPPGYRVNAGFWSWTADQYSGNDGQQLLTLPSVSNERFCSIEMNTSSGGNQGLQLYFTYVNGRVKTSSPMRSGNGSIPDGWYDWSRTIQNPDADFVLAKNTGGSTAFKTANILTGDVIAHPGKSEDAVLQWTSPAAGNVVVKALLSDAQLQWGDGVTYTLRTVKADNSNTTTLRTGVMGDSGSVDLRDGSISVAMAAGDKLELVLCAKGSNNDPNNNAGDMTKVWIEAKLTEAEKNFEQTPVVPTIQFELTDNGRTLHALYRNMKGDDLNIAMQKRGDGIPGARMSFGTGDGEVYLPWLGRPSGLDTYDIFLTRGESWTPLDVPFASFRYTADGDNWKADISSQNIIRFPDLAHDALLDANRTPSEAEIADQVFLTDYRHAQTLPAPARDWTEGHAFNWIDKAHQFGVIRLSELGHALVGQGGLYKVIFDIPANKFVLHKALSDGSASIEGLEYLTNDGLKKLPAQYYEMLPNGSIITKPNCPGQIIYDLRLTGTFSGGPDNGSDTIDALLPISGQKLVGGIQQLQAQPGNTQGFGGTISEFRETQSPVFLPGTSVNVIAQFESIGTQGGPITVRTYCGYTGSVMQDQLQNTFTKDFPVNGRYSLTFNAGAPNNPPSQNARAIITIEVQYANGTKEILGQRMGKPSTDRTFNRIDPASGRTVTTFIDYTPEELVHLQRLADRIGQLTGTRPTFVGDPGQGGAITPNSYYQRVAEQILRNGDPNARALSFGQQLTLAMTKINKELFVDTFTSTQLSQNVSNPDAQAALSIDKAQAALTTCTQNPTNTPARNTLIAFFMDTFGVPQAQAISYVDTCTQTPPSTLQQALSWFNGNENVEGLTYFVRNDTLMGKTFLGLLQEAKRHNTFADHIRIAHAMEDITGINMIKVLHVLERSDGDWARICGRMKNLFTTGQYGHIFSPKPSPEQDFLMVQPDKDQASPYVSGDRIRVRFDMVASDANYDHILPYLWQNGVQVDTQHAVSGETKGRLFLDIQLFDAAKQKVATGPAQISLVAWLPLQNQNGFRTTSKLSNTITIPDHAELAFNAQDVLGVQWYSLSDTQKDTVKKALNFGEGVPNKNVQLINWLVNYIKTNETINTGGDLGWIGTAIQNDPNTTEDDTFFGECKYWLQKNVIFQAFGITIPANKNNDYAWQSSQYTENVTSEGIACSLFKDTVLNNNLVKAGDMIQVSGSNFGGKHTMAIGKIENDGIWVFDCNYQITKTPRYHKILYSTFAQAALFTIYRLK